MSAVNRLTHELSKLPGIGQKTALRLVLHILKQPGTYARALAASLMEVAEKVRFCTQCFHLTDVNPCTICVDPKRKKDLLCVVEESSDLMAIERAGGYRGLYHVLQGCLSPLDGIGPEQLRVQELVARLHSVHEVILATNLSVTGDATALYLAKLIKPAGLRVTKLASGLPVGSEIEYVDHVTLARALESRIEY